MTRERDAVLYVYMLYISGNYVKDTIHSYIIE